MRSILDSFSGAALGVPRSTGTKLMGRPLAFLVCCSPTWFSLNQPSLVLPASRHATRSICQPGGSMLYRSNTPCAMSSKSWFWNKSVTHSLMSRTRSLARNWKNARSWSWRLLSRAWMLSWARSCDPPPAPPRPGGGPTMLGLPFWRGGSWARRASEGMGLRTPMASFLL
jgi:hypothetical protein